MKRLLVLLTFFCQGCGVTEPIETEPPPLIFIGEPAAKPIDFNLSGVWKAFRFETPDKPGKIGPWEAIWRLRQIGAQCWEDANGQGVFKITRPGQTHQHLIWNRTNGPALHLSVNDCIHNTLIMNGDDGEQYMAIRTEKD